MTRMQIADREPRGMADDEILAELLELGRRTRGQIEHVNRGMVFTAAMLDPFGARRDRLEAELKRRGR